MPALLLLLAVPLLVVVMLALVPVGLVVRYRTGTTRRRARGWITAVNIVGASISVVMLIVTAVVTAIWVPRAPLFVVVGFAVGALLGVVGLRLSRWEPDGERLHFTPFRPLVFILIALLAFRVGLNVYRAWILRGGSGEESWLAAVGVAESMGVAAVFIAYTLVYWLGVRGRLRAHALGRDRAFETGLS